MNDSKKEQSVAVTLNAEGIVCVSGELSFNTVPALVLNNRDFFKNNNGLDIDLANVSRADSAGVALLVEWQRQARKQNQSICFHHIPSQMLAIARLSGVDELLSLKT